jgi:hypothetical protein
MYYNNGKFYEKEDKDGLFSCFTPVKNETQIVNIADVSPVWHGKGHIKLKQWREMLSFFYWGWSKTKSEQLISIFYNPATEDFLFYPFPQFCVGMTVREDEKEKTAAREKHVPLGYMFFGTVHHHCDSSAFQSSTDERDESIGFHATIGHISSNAHSLHVRWITRDPETGQKITYENNGKNETDGLNMFSLFNPMNVQEVKIFSIKELFLLLRNELTMRAEIDFPKHWEESVKGHLAQSRGFYDNYYQREWNFGAGQAQTRYPAGYSNTITGTNQLLSSPTYTSNSTYIDEYDWYGDELVDARLSLASFNADDLDLLTEEYVKRFPAHKHLPTSDLMINISQLPETTLTDLINKVSKKKRNDGDDIDFGYDSWTIVERKDSLSFYSKRYLSYIDEQEGVGLSNFYNLHIPKEMAIAWFLKESGILFLYPKMVNETALFPIVELELNKNDQKSSVFYTFGSYSATTTAPTFPSKGGQLVKWHGYPLTNEPVLLFMFVEKKSLTSKEIIQIRNKILQDSNFRVGAKNTKSIPHYTLVFEHSMYDSDNVDDLVTEIRYDYYTSNVSEAHETMGVFAREIIQQNPKESITKEFARYQTRISLALCDEFFLSTRSGTPETNSWKTAVATGVAMDTFLQILFNGFGIDFDLQEFSCEALILEIADKHANLLPYLLLDKIGLPQELDAFSLKSKVNIDEIIERFEKIPKTESYREEQILFVLFRAVCLAQINDFSGNYENYDIINETTSLSNFDKNILMEMAINHFN